MQRMLLAPAFAAFKRLSFGAGFALVGATFVLPPLLALALWPEARALPNAALLLVAGLYLFAFYVLTALYSYMIFGVGRLIRVADRIAGGELVTSKASVRDDSKNNDTDRLWGSIMKMNGSLAVIVRQVRNSAETIAGVSRDVKEGHLHLSQRTEEQAASVEETAAGIEQLAATARHNAEGCERASGLATLAQGVAGKAAEQMDGVATRMREIEEASRRVGEILATVEGIAFQTNILALNAAVEAARAGDEGRGFAVVAGEVRGLAQRSAQAAKEIQQLLVASRASVKGGRELVDSAGLTMREVVGSVQRVGQVIDEIAMASTQQSAGAAEVNRAIAQIDQATQHNAALVEEATSAAQSFEAEAARLLDAVRKFKLD